jgi:hypothetical protein
MDLSSIIFYLGIPGVAVICWAVTQIAKEWRKTREAECRMALKQEMVQRGMSADDIIRVLSADAAAPETTYCPRRGEHGNVAEGKGQPA